MFLKKLKVAAAALLTLFACLGVALLAHSAFAAAGDDPFAQAGSTPRNPDDKPAKTAEPDRGRDKLNDAEFIRRACLDIRGTLPTPIEVHYFLQDKNPDKRKWLVGKLSEEKTADDNRKAIDAVQKKLLEQIEALRRAQEERDKGNRAKEVDKDRILRELEAIKKWLQEVQPDNQRLMEEFKLRDQAIERLRRFEKKQTDDLPPPPQQLDRELEELRRLEAELRDRREQLKKAPR